VPNIVKLRLNLLKLFSENYRCFFLTRCSVYDHAVRESGVESHGIAGQCQAVDESSADWWICCTHLLWSATGRLHWPLVRRYAAVYWRRGWQREPGQRTCDYKTVIANSTYGLPRPAIGYHGYSSRQSPSLTVYCYSSSQNSWRSYLMYMYIHLRSCDLSKIINGKQSYIHVLNLFS